MLDQVEALIEPRVPTIRGRVREHPAPGWTLALASREALPLPTARMRVERPAPRDRRRRPGDDRAEAARLLEAVGVELPGRTDRELVARTEGWPAALYLAALAIRTAARRDAARFTGDDRLMSDYLRSEMLDRVSRSQRTFLVRTSILDRMSGPLCDAVVGGDSRPGLLEELNAGTCWCVPLDRRGEWYRYHHLLRQLLRAELRRASPGPSPSCTPGPRPGTRRTGARAGDRPRLSGR